MAEKINSTSSFPPDSPIRHLLFVQGNYSPSDNIGYFCRVLNGRRSRSSNSCVWLLSTRRFLWCSVRTLFLCCSEFRYYECTTTYSSILVVTNILVVSKREKYAAMNNASAMVWLCPPRIICWKLNAQVMVLGGRAFGRWLGCESGAQMNEIHALLKGVPEG